MFRKNNQSQFELHSPAQQPKMAAMLTSIVFMIILTTNHQKVLGYNSDDGNRDYYKQRYKDFPITAELGDTCELLIQTKYVDPIYEQMKAGRLTKIKELDKDLETYLVASQKASLCCYGYKPMQVFNNEVYSKTKYHKCDPASLKCVCYDEEPLLHIPDSNSVTGCSLKEPQRSDSCNPNFYKQEYEKQFLPIFKFLARARNDDEHKYAAAQWYGTDAYTFGIRQDFFTLRRQICLNRYWSMVCDKSTSKCVCRRAPPHFQFKHDGRGGCFPIKGSVCNSWDKQGDNRCEAPSTCQQVYFQNPLKGCGTISDWDEAKKQPFEPEGGYSEGSTLRIQWGLVLVTYLASVLIVIF